MPSKFGWVDFAEEDRQKMLDLVKLFRVRDTRDELGIGTIRDAFADHFSPGTMTMQTRARYFFFIPWIYEGLGNWLRQPRPAERVDYMVRLREAALIKHLRKRESAAGVIGASAGAELQRMPSSIYWTGLGRLGLRLFPGSQNQFHRRLARQSMVRGGSRGGDYLSGETEDLSVQATAADWHPGLPEPPGTFPRRATFRLRRSEAQYLADRINETHPESLFAALALRWDRPAEVEFAWEHPIVPDLTAELQTTLSHARDFSECMHGVALLYNLLLAQKREEPAWIEDHKESLAEWAGLVGPRWDELRQWGSKLSGFWHCPALTGAAIPLRTKGFVERVLRLLFGGNSPRAFTQDARMHELIRTREVQLKGGKRARLVSPEALARWGGASGTGRLDYRWSTTRTMLEDIYAGMRNGSGNPDA